MCIRDGTGPDLLRWEWCSPPLAGLGRDLRTIKVQAQVSLQIQIMMIKPPPKGKVDRTLGQLMMWKNLGTRWVHVDLSPTLDSPFIKNHLFAQFLGLASHTITGVVNLYPY